MSLSRRDLGKMALAALPAARLLAKTDSKFGGVQIGINAPYSFHQHLHQRRPVSGGRRCPKLNLSSVELRAQPIEQFMGAPANLVAYPAVRQANAAGGGQAKGASGDTKSAADTRKAGAEELRSWRLAASMDKVVAFRKKYADAGAKIDIVKVDAIDTFSDEEIDYMFGLAKTAGAKAISCEIPLSPHQAAGRVRRITHDDDWLSRPYEYHQPRGFWTAGKLGDGYELFQVQRHQPGYWPLHCRE